MRYSIADILSNTPIRVFLLLGYLIFRSALSLRPRVVPLTRIWIVPGVFIVFGVFGLFNRPMGFFDIIGRWCAGAATGCALGLLSHPALRFDRDQKLVWLPGSIQPLLRVFVIFGAHYALNVLAALQPNMRDSYLGWDTVVSGASTGYFVGWLVRFSQSCNRSGKSG